MKNLETTEGVPTVLAVNKKYTYAHVHNNTYKPQYI
jgi:hypothetical protein